MLCSTLTLGACSPDEPLTEIRTPVPKPEPPGGNDNDKEDAASRDINIRIGNASFAATLADNSAAKAFAALLPMTLRMNEMNGNEKYGSLPQSLPTDAIRPGTIRTGDLLLYGSSTVVLFYETFSSSYSYTPLGQVDNPAGLAASLGRGDATVTFETNR